MKQDKKKHILAGLFVAALVGLPCYLEHADLFAGLWSALVSGIAIAACKEWCDNDYSLHGYFDWRDFCWTLLGAVVIALLILGLHYGKG